MTFELNQPVWLCRKETGGKTSKSKAVVDAVCGPWAHVVGSERLDDVPVTFSVWTRVNASRTWLEPVRT